MLTVYCGHSTHVYCTGKDQNKSEQMLFIQFYIIQDLALCFYLYIFITIGTGKLGGVIFSASRGAYLLFTSGWTRLFNL